jgi:hypothetical protein
MDDLAKKALTRTLSFSAFVGLLVLVPAGPAFWQGWLYWIVFSTCSLVIALFPSARSRARGAAIAREIRAGSEPKGSA